MMWQWCVSPVEQCGCHLGVAEDTSRFRQAEIGGDDDTGMLVKLASCFTSLLSRWNSKAPPDALNGRHLSFIGEPDCYRGTGHGLGLGDFFQDGGKTFLKSSIAPSDCA
jgi:hypothetical protein